MSTTIIPINIPQNTEINLARDAAVPTQVKYVGTNTNSSAPTASTMVVNNKTEMFIDSLNKGQMLVKNISSGEVKTLSVKPQVVEALHLTSVKDLEVRDNRIVPKQNYSRVDPALVNIHGHKGPDEAPDYGPDPMPMV